MSCMKITFKKKLCIVLKIKKVNCQYIFFSDDVTVDPEPSWRQAFLIERGKMTEDRFAKIRSEIDHIANITLGKNCVCALKKQDELVTC